MLPKGAFRSTLMENLPRASFLISISLYRVVHDYFVAATRRVHTLSTPKHGTVRAGAVQGSGSRT